MNKNHSNQVKKSLLLRYAEGESVTTLANEYSVSRSTIYRWIKNNQSEITNNKKLKLRDYHDLTVKCQRQEKIIEILKTSPCLVTAPLRERYEVIIESK